MHRLAPTTPRASPQMLQRGPLSPNQPTRQCLCAYVRPFTEDQAISHDKASSSGTPSWEAPKEWESSIEHALPPQDRWNMSRGIARPARAQFRLDHTAQTMVSTSIRIDVVKDLISAVTANPALFLAGPSYFQHRAAPQCQQRHPPPEGRPAEPESPKDRPLSVPRSTALDQG